MACLLNTIKAVIFLRTLSHFSLAQSPTTSCDFEGNPKTVFFPSLREYQLSRHSFNPHNPTYNGNFVQFTFKNIDKLEKNAFIGFESNFIIKLDLSHKGIKTIEDGAFNELLCLHYLELNHNNISVLTENVFLGLENLRQLDLSVNLIEELDNLVFRDLSYLEVLDLSRNTIKSMKTLAFANLTMLKVLNLGFNKIRTVSPSLFSSLRSLRELYLNNNHLGNVEPEKWTGLNNLTLLNLAENSLTRFDPTYNFSFSRLRQLNISGNYLSLLNVFGLRKHFPKLEAIDITENNWYCSDLEVIKYNLLDSKISLNGNPNCSDSGVYRRPTSERSVTVPAVPSTTTVTSRGRDYSKEVFAQNGQVLLTNNKILEYIQHLETLVIYLFVIVIIFVIVDISARIGVCHNLYGRLTGRGRDTYLDGSDAEHLVLVRR